MLAGRVLLWDNENVSHIEIVTSPLTGMPITVVRPSTAEAAEFREELMKAGFTNAQQDRAVEDALPLLIQRWTPWEAAEMLAIVVTLTGSADDQILGCALAARTLATFTAGHPGT